jgi:hypothetical protein
MSGLKNIEMQVLTAGISRTNCEWLRLVSTFVCVEWKILSYPHDTKLLSVVR